MLINYNRTSLKTDKHISSVGCHFTVVTIAIVNIVGIRIVIVVAVVVIFLLVSFLLKLFDFKLEREDEGINVVREIVLNSIG